MLKLNVGALITDDAATIIMQGGGDIQSYDTATSEYESITQTMDKVDSGGLLDFLLQQRNAYPYWDTLNDFGTIELSSGASLAATSLYVGSAGALVTTGNFFPAVDPTPIGTINGWVVNDGVITAGDGEMVASGKNFFPAYGHLTITGDVTGSGQLQIMTSRCSNSAARMPSPSIPQAGRVN